MSHIDVKHFADLARIEMSEEELQKMSNEMESILDYVDQLKRADGEIKNDSDNNNSTNNLDNNSDNNSANNSDDNSINNLQGPIESAGVRNVFREDQNPNVSGLNTNKILAEAPETEKGYIKVKKIL